MRWFNTLLHDESGQDMVEYGLLSALISIVAVVTLKAIGPLTANLFHLKYKMRMP